VKFLAVIPNFRTFESSRRGKEEEERERERERRRRRLTAMGRLAASPHHESFHKRNSGFNPKV